ncbi:radical SAM protein [Chitinophaga agrisoli]|uniref:Radical SAM protein n=1 Tax=Chitinophaga agrisoli TaxID=2607653 RepID=A0A5B2VL52_9BACT|nr:radical SAM protein [Chitinophaga agrisoli]KAA2239022.1 radical SAM protein [Chitinophaga agrisoli]
MTGTSIYHTFQRYRTLQTDRITALPIVILMPHSACNCRCVMCDIWKDNKNLKQLTEADVNGLMNALRKFGTQQVLMSGGEALLSPNFFRLCQIIKSQGIRISLLSTGLAIKHHAADILQWVDDVIISLDGDEALHDQIRNIPHAFKKLQEGIAALKAVNPQFRVTGRTVIHRLNYRQWPAIIAAAKTLQLDQISFLPADVSSNAFNRPTAWDEPRQDEILISEAELPALQTIVDNILLNNKDDFHTRFIAESPLKIQHIYQYYSAFYGHNAFPYKKCNAPWVSAVIEADGSVRPCFFHEVMGNIRDASLEDIINSKKAIAFRKSLDMDKDDTCVKCVCALNLRPGAKLN